MNLTQMAAHSSIMSVGVKPRIIQAYANTATTTPITVTIPRYTGMLCIVMIFTTGGTAIPATLSGFTSLGSQAASATQCGARYQYKFLNGSEAATLTSAAASATGLIAQVMLIDGAISSRVPTVGSPANATTATPNPNAVTVTAPVTQTLIIPTVGYFQTGGAVPTMDGLPAGFVFQKSNTTTVAAQIGATFAWLENQCVSSFDPGTFALSASTVTSSFTFAVRGA